MLFLGSQLNVCNLLIFMVLLCRRGCLNSYPEDFIQTNILGTFRLLESVRSYWSALPADDKAAFRFLHVSTDEVYGTLSKEDPSFAEDNRYEPNSLHQRLLITSTTTTAPQPLRSIRAADVHCYAGKFIQQS